MNYFLLFLFCVGYFSTCHSKEEKLFSQKDTIVTLYKSLDPLSLPQQLAFYELYKDTDEGKAALSSVWKLLTKEHPQEEKSGLSFPTINLDAIVALITRQSFDPPILLQEEELTLIEKISSFLDNRKLLGSTIWTKEELDVLPCEEIDLARALLINQYEKEKDFRTLIRQYEASLDLMALQIIIRLQGDKNPESMIREMNRLIFHEMQFRFPPHSLFAKDVDLYTFLPSVLDSRQGVCLGVSILYLSLAQRLSLPLEIITPPGHIYVRYHENDNIINIETTARGINLPSETYLGVDTRSLPQRTIREVIGMAYINHASVAWSKENYSFAIQLYEKALPYVPEDPLVKMLLGLNYLFVGKTTEGEKLLRQIQHYTFDYAVSPHTYADDYLTGKVDVEGLKAIFLPVDETRQSIIDKQRQIQKILVHYPKFRAGLFHLAVTYFQLGRQNEALQTLEQYHKIDSTDCVVEYYLSALCLERYDYKKAWTFLKNAEYLAHRRDHHPKVLRSLRNSLKMVYPEET